MVKNNPIVEIDYIQIGAAQQFTIPMFTIRQTELVPSTIITVVGDGVPDRLGLINAWPDDTHITISLL